MIFVTIGTTDFDLLIEKMDELAPTLGEKVIFQIGNSKYLPKSCAYFRYAPSLSPYYDQADVVISQGGMAVTFEVLARGIKLISIENTTYADGHQKEILQILSKEGYLVWCRNLDELPLLLKNVATIKLKPYLPPPCTIADVIKDYLKNVA